MTYQVKNRLLENIGDWALNEKSIPQAKENWNAFREFYNANGKSDPTANVNAKEVLKDVYTYPIFSDVFCQILLDEIKNIKETNYFSANQDEDELRQIPEFVISDHAQDMYKGIAQAILAIAGPEIWAIWHNPIEHVHVQIANYNPKDKKKGAWHHDKSADITVVVPLNTGEYEGGGTEFANKGVVGPLPNGHGLIFPSFTNLHRGLAVESGERYLLVFWLKGEVDAKD